MKRVLFVIFFLLYGCSTVTVKPTADILVDVSVITAGKKAADRYPALKQYFIDTCDTLLTADIKDVQKFISENTETFSGNSDLKILIYVLNNYVIIDNEIDLTKFRKYVTLFKQGVNLSLG